MSMDVEIVVEQVGVPNNIVGKIIGRGGEQISKLQEKSDCKIQIDADNGGNPVRMITLTGTASANSYAKTLIEEIVRSDNPRRPMNDHDGGGFEHAEILVPGSKVGLLIGRGGDTIKQLQELTGAKIIVVQESSQLAEHKPVRISGPPDVVANAKSRIIELLSQTKDEGNRGPRGPGYGYNQEPSGFHGGGGGQREDFISSVSVSSDKVGLVIGKGGETIRSINQASGAYCSLDKRAPQDAAEKKFIIRGTPQNVERAKQMVLEKIGATPGSGYGSFPGQTFGASGNGFQGEPSAPGNHVQMQQTQAAPQGTQDYSAQWAEYYRSLGMYKEAEQMERQNRNSAAPTGAPAQPTQDYSAQWVEYYRSIGKFEEAAAVEAEIRERTTNSYIM